MNIEDIVERIVLRVAELPDRSSPDDQPTMMLVTDAELREILREELQSPKKCTCKDGGIVGMYDCETCPVHGSTEK